MTTLLDAPFKDAITLVEFTWGPVEDPTLRAERYADIEDDVWAPVGVDDIAKFNATPNMGLDIPQVTAGIIPERCEIKVPFVLGGFSDRISDGLPHAPIRCRVMEMLTSPSHQFPVVGPAIETRSPTIKHLFSGPMMNATRNPNSRSGLVKIEVFSPKIDLKNKPMGALTNPQCDNTFGGTGCYIDFHDPAHIRYPFVVFDSVVSVVGHTVQMLDTATQLSGTFGKFVDGFIEFEGLRIKIVSESSTVAGEFTTVDPIPPHVISQIVRVVAGCGKTKSECQFYVNEKNFAAYGFAIPSHNPLYEPQA